MRLSNYEIPYWKKYTLSIEEAAAYFRIGEGKLRRLVQENPRADYLLWNGNRVQIKREKFEEIAAVNTHATFYAGWPKAWAVFNLASLKSL